MNAVDGVADILPGGDDDGEGQQDHGGDAPETQHRLNIPVVRSIFRNLLVYQQRGPNNGDKHELSRMTDLAKNTFINGIRFIRK